MWKAARHALSTVRTDGSAGQPLCLGTMNFGPQTTEDESHAIMDRALELGINFFDTANVTAATRATASTEKIIGRWFAQGGGRREKIVLATKVYGAMGDWPNDGRLSALHIRARVRRQPAPPADRPHRPLPDAPRRPRRAVGRDLAGDGARWSSRARSPTSAAATSPAGTSPRRNEAARPRHFSASSASRASTTCSTAPSSSRCCPPCDTTASGVIPWSPLRGRPARRRARRSRPRAPAAPQSLRRIDKLRPQLEQWEKLCADLGEDPADVALAWLLAQHGVTARSSARAPSSSSTAPRCAPSTSRSTPTR